MKLRKVKSSLLVSMLVMGIPFNTKKPVLAVETDDMRTTALKERWEFNGAVINNKVLGDNKTEAEIHGQVTIVEEVEPFEKVVSFGAGTGNYLKISNYVNTKNKYSFTFWMKYDSSIANLQANASAVILQQTGNGKTILDLKADGHLHTFVDGKDHVSTHTVGRNKWQHVGFAINPETMKAQIYINGFLDKEIILNGSMVNSMTDLLIGSHKNTGSNDPHPMRGKLDDIRIFNDTINAKTVKLIYDEKVNVMLLNQEIKPLIAKLETVVKQYAHLKDDIQYQTLVTKLDIMKDSLANNDTLSTNYNELKTAFEVFKASIPVELKINKDNITRTIDAQHIFGINHRYAFNGYGSFNSTTKKIYPEFAELYKKAHFGSIRFPGGTISNLFNWKTSIGSVEHRKNQIHGFYNNPNQEGIAPNFGLMEFAKFAEENNSEIVYVYSLARGNSQDAGDLMEFLNAKVGLNPNGGTDWAQVRADLGHEAPFKVKFFEIGNEMQQNYAEGTSSQSYWTNFVPNKGQPQSYVEGGVASFTKQYAVAEEDWNKKTSVSDGSPNLRRYMRYANVNPLKYMGEGRFEIDPEFQAVKKEGIAVYVGDDRNHEQWMIVDSFTNSSATDKHVMIDYATGAVVFGDGVHGAIPPKGKSIYVSYKVEREGFINLAKSMKQTMQKINESQTDTPLAQIYSGFEGERFIILMNENNANEWYDGMTIHPYSQGANGDTADSFYDDVMRRSEHQGVDHVRNLAAKLPEGKVPVISEFGIFRSTKPQVRSLTHALYVAKSMLEYVKLGSPYIQKHTLIDWYSSGADSLGPTQQAVIQAVPQNGADTKTGEGTYRYFATPTAHVFEMFNNGFGNKVLEANLGETITTTGNYKAISTLASEDALGNVYVAIVNADREKAYRIHSNLFTGKNLEVQVLTHDNIAAENSLEQLENVKIIKESVPSTDGMLSVKAHSFVVVKIPTDKKINLDDKKIVLSDDKTGVRIETNGTVLSATTKVFVTEKILQRDGFIGKHYDISLQEGNTRIQPNGKVRVTIPYQAQNVANVEAKYFSDGTYSDVEDVVYKNGEVSFTTSHFAAYFVGERQAVANKNNENPEVEIPDPKAEVPEDRPQPKTEFETPKMEMKKQNISTNDEEIIFYLGVCISLLGVFIIKKVRTSS